MNPELTRREVIKSLAIASIGSPFIFGTGCKSDLSLSPREKVSKEISDLSRVCYLDKTWNRNHYNDFLDCMGEDTLKRTIKTLEIKNADYTSTTDMQEKIKNKIADSCGLFENKNRIDYHDDIVIPIAKKLCVQDNVINRANTIQLERAIYDKTFERYWDAMNENEKEILINKSGWKLSKKEILTITAATGATIIAALAGAVAIFGFGFYMGMSSGLFGLAASVGIALPFAAYTGMSTAISLATGPIGWTIAAILACFAVYAWIVKDKETHDKTKLQALMHFHNLKVASLNHAKIFRDDMLKYT